MGTINRFITKKCIFCGGKQDVKYVPDWGLYGGMEGSGDHYHDECVRQICADPEGAGHKLVDRAIDIMERVKELKEDQEKEDQERKEKIESLCI